MPEYVTLDIHRGPMLTGFVSCGRSPQNPDCLVSVLITHGRDPSFDYATGSGVKYIGPWQEGTMPEYLEVEAMLHAVERGFYVAGKV